MLRYDLRIGALLNDAQLSAIELSDAKANALSLSEEIVEACIPRYGLTILECARLVYEAGKSSSMVEFCDLLREARDRLPRVTLR